MPNFQASNLSLTQPTFTKVPSTPTNNRWDDARVVSVTTDAIIEINTDSLSNAVAGTYTLDLVLTRDKTRVETQD